MNSPKFKIISLFLTFFASYENILGEEIIPKSEKFTKKMLIAVDYTLVDPYNWTGTKENNILVVGVNSNIEDNQVLKSAMKIDSGNENKQITKLINFKKRRNEDEILKKLNELREVCQGTENIMPSLIESLKIGATVGEVNGIMREVFGTWVSPSGV